MANDSLIGRIREFFENIQIGMYDEDDIHGYVSSFCEEIDHMGDASTRKDEEDASAELRPPVASPPSSPANIGSEISDTVSLVKDMAVAHGMSHEPFCDTSYWKDEFDRLYGKFLRSFKSPMPVTVVQKTPKSEPNLKGSNVYDEEQPMSVSPVPQWGMKSDPMPEWAKGQPDDCREAYEQWANTMQFPLYKSVTRTVGNEQIAYDDNGRWLAWQAAWDANLPSFESVRGILSPDVSDAVEAATWKYEELRKDSAVTYAMSEAIKVYERMSAPKREISDERMIRIAKELHYPECWDTAAYPTIYDAIIEASRCSECNP